MVCAAHSRHDQPAVRCHRKPKVPMPNRPALLFDVMDTLVYNPFNREIPAFFGLSPAALLAEKDPTAWPQFELGQIDEPEYFRRYFRDRRTFDHVGFRQVVEEAYRWLEGAQTLLCQLSDAGFEIHAFSNYPVWYRAIEARLGLSRYLEWTFVSCLTGIRKPTLAAYEQAARRLERAPEGCLFIDDRRENCEAAVAMGMPAIHFVDVAALRRELSQRGLLD